jgi:hypothetical protein
VRGLENTGAEGSVLLMGQRRASDITDNNPGGINNG